MKYDSININETITNKTNIILYYSKKNNGYVIKLKALVLGKPIVLYRSDPDYSNQVERLKRLINTIL